MAFADPALALGGVAMIAQLGKLIHWNSRVTQISGDRKVYSVDAGLYRIDADIVALGYGFSSSSELARSLGCAHRFVARGTGSMETVVDRDGRTSLEEVFAIGDGARFGGAQSAQAQGQVALVNPESKDYMLTYNPGIDVAIFAFPWIGFERIVVVT